MKIVDIEEKSFVSSEQREKSQWHFQGRSDL